MVELKDIVYGGYKILDDGSIYVDGSVNLSNKNLDLIPFNFSEVTGSFNCSDNNLTSLKGSPKIVGTYFNCSHNKLTNLEYGPEIVKVYYDATYNKLTSLKGLTLEETLIYIDDKLFDYVKLKPLGSIKNYDEIIKTLKRNFKIKSLLNNKLC